VRPYISTIICTYREKKDHLEAAVDSVLGQKNVKVQLILSTVEGDPAIDFAAKRNIEVVVFPKPGIYQQLNAALSRVRGDWFCYFSGNDVALPEKYHLEWDSCIRANAIVGYSDYYVVDENLQNRKRRRCGPYSRSRHLRGNFVSDVSLVRGDILRKFGPFKEEFGNSAYWDFWLRISKVYPDRFVYCPEPTWLYRVYEGSRHMKRKRDKKAQIRNTEERRRMLATHGVRI